MMPRAEGTWPFTLSPLSDQGEGPAPVTFEATVNSGEESIERLEFYFDHGPQGTKSLVLAWGNKTAQVAVAEPAARTVGPTHGTHLLPTARPASTTWSRTVRIPCL